MKPWTVFFLILILPPLIAVLLFVPIILGAAGGMYLIHHAALDPDNLMVLFDIPRLSSVYYNFYVYQQTANPDFLAFSLPAFGPLALGVIIGLGLVYALIRYLQRIMIMLSGV